jgi:hypothetical protein
MVWIYSNFTANLEFAMSDAIDYGVAMDTTLEVCMEDSFCAGGQKSHPHICSPQCPTQELQLIS